jgi:hypothetical protein
VEVDATSRLEAEELKCIRSVGAKRNCVWVPAQVAEPGAIKGIKRSLWEISKWKNSFRS